MKLALLGNCQVEVYRALLEASALPGISEVAAFEVWRYKADAFPDIAKAIAGYDVVVSQMLSDNYGPISTSALLRSPQKVVRVLNIFFPGYVPDCAYIGPMGGRKKSIVGDYHSRHVHDCWSTGVTVADCIEGLRNYAPEKVAEAFRTGIDELLRREAEVDVPASDLVLDPSFGPSNFFTFNHPKVELHRRYLERILTAAGIPATVTVCPDPLVVHTHWPIYPAVRAHLGTDQPDQELRFVASRSLGGQSYTLEEFCEQSYQHYSENS